MSDDPSPAPPQSGFIVDAHLDLAYNALRGRNLLIDAAHQQADDMGIPSVSIPDLRRGGVGLIGATIFCEPGGTFPSGYANAEQATEAGWRHVQWYHEREVAGDLRIVRNAEEISPRPGGLATILLMEGADPIRSSDDVPRWFDAGLRIVGLAWKATRLAGGTGAAGPITDEGRRLVAAMDAVGIMHDVSHLADESFWQLIEITAGPIIASHSNCRAIVPTDRQLSDEMIRAIEARGGIIGINFFDKFLISPAEKEIRRATLADVVRHIDHIAQMAGHTRCIGIGTDMDGGFSQANLPTEIECSADLPRLAAALNDQGYLPSDIAGIMGRNWERYFRANLPG